VSSPLDDIPGIGAKKKKALLLYFGSAKDVAAAGIQDLQNVDGISKINAEKIYNYFQDQWFSEKYSKITTTWTIS